VRPGTVLLAPYLGGRSDARSGLPGGLAFAPGSSPILVDSRSLDRKVWYPGRTAGCEPHVAVSRPPPRPGVAPMSAAKPPSDELLSRAAELRAGGSTWDAVAAKLNRSADTVRRWPALDPDRWQAALRAAERRLVAEAGAESVLVLRTLLRSED